eukprot:3972884-Prymnesium_polylepis.1
MRVEDARQYSERISQSISQFVPSTEEEGVSSRYVKIIRTGCCDRFPHPQLSVGNTGAGCTADARQCEANCTTIPSCRAFSISRSRHECYFCKACHRMRPEKGDAGVDRTTWMLATHEQLGGLRRARVELVSRSSDLGRKMAPGTLPK